MAGPGWNSACMMAAYEGLIVLKRQELEHAARGLKP